MALQQLQDARHMVGVADAAELKKLWSDWLQKHAILAVDRPEKPVVYVNHGRWVADCPVCNSGMLVLPDNPSLQCLDCGSFFKAKVMPSKRDQAAIEKALGERPNPANRNFHPAREPVGILEVENDAMLRGQIEEG